MIKNLLNKNVFRALSVVLMVCFTAVSSFGQVAGDFRTLASGNWSAAATWETYNGVTWAAATAAPIGSEAGITVLATHTIVLDVDVPVSGYVKNQATATITTSTGKKLTFGNGSTFEHNTNAAMSAVYAWGVGSTCKMTGFVASTGGSSAGQPYYNLIWDCPAQTATFNLTMPDLNTIGGNVTINNTNTGKVRLTSMSGAVAKTINITGNYIQNGGTVEATGSSATGLLTVNVGGNISVAGGSMFLVGSGCPFIWNLTGNLSLTPAGSITKGSGVGSLTFVGSGTHIFNRAATGTTIVTNATAAMVWILGGTGTLTLGTSIYDGGGNFIVNAGTTLECGATAGISGNIQTVGVKTFDVGASYTFNGVAGQVTSALLPATVKNLTVNNTGGVTLSAATTVSSALTLTVGNLTLGANDLTAGSFVGGSASSHVLALSSGVLKSAIAAATPKSFPIGANATSYDPVSISPANAVTFGAKVKDSYSNPVALNYETQVVQREWDLSPSATPGSTNVGFTPHSGALTVANTPATISTAEIPNCIIGHWNGSVWESATTADYASGTWSLAAYSGTFSPFVVSAKPVSLSVDLQNFTAKAQGNTNLLAWKTANEKDNAAFQIERSANGIDFVNIGTVKGNGSKTSVSDYTFLDEGPLSIAYYRLLSVDNNGLKKASNIATVVRSTNDKTRLFPTLAADKVTLVSDSNTNQTFNIFDLTGRNVQSGALFTSQQDVSVSHLSSGIYILKVGSDAVKFVKQ